MASHGTISSTRFRRTANYKLPSKGSSVDLGGFRHFISTPTDEQRFTLDGVRFDPSDPRQWARAENLMKRLAHLIRLISTRIKRNQIPICRAATPIFCKSLRMTLCTARYRLRSGRGRRSGSATCEMLHYVLKQFMAEGQPNARTPMRQVGSHSVASFAWAIRGSMRAIRIIKASERTSREAPRAPPRSLPNGPVTPRP